MVSCEHWRTYTETSGPQWIYPAGTSPVALVFCTYETGETFTAILLKTWSGAVNFSRDYDTYQKGFGNTVDGYFIGLDTLHKLIGNTSVMLTVQQKFGPGSVTYSADYTQFSVGSSSDCYRLAAGGFSTSVPFLISDPLASGAAGDANKIANGMCFSTYDNDQDLSAENCAEKYSGGGWWYNDCTLSTLTATNNAQNAVQCSFAHCTRFHVNHDYPSSVKMLFHREGK